MATASDSIRRAKPLLGTFVEIEVAGPPRPERHDAIDAAFEAIEQVHQLMSFHESGSDVSRLNLDAFHRPIRVHAWTYQVLEAALDMHRRSNGMFDVAVAPALQTIGLLPMQGGHPGGHRSVSSDMIELLDGRSVRFRHAATRIDLGGIAKGFAVDKAIEALRNFGVMRGLVNAGGDLAALGSEPQTIHIRNPRDPSRLICGIEIADEALASTARRFDLLHATDTTPSAIIDPATDRPVEAFDGATVRAPSCMIADALTKIVMISGTDAIGPLEHYNASALLIARDGSLQITPDWHRAVHLAA